MAAARGRGGCRRDQDGLLDHRWRMRDLSVSQEVQVGGRRLLVGALALSPPPVAVVALWLQLLSKSLDRDVHHAKWSQRQLKAVGRRDQTKQTALRVGGIDANADACLAHRAAVASSCEPTTVIARLMLIENRR